MEFLTQYPPANPSVSNPTPLYYPPSTINTPPPAPNKSRKWMWWTIGAVILIGLGGGGYYASSQGLVTIPFLPSSSSLVKNIVSQYSGMSAMTSELTFSVKSTSTSAATTPTPVANDNFNIGLGTANLKADLGQTEVTVTATSYTEPSKPWNDSNSETKLTVRAKVLGLNIDAVATVRKVGTKAYAQLEKLDGYEGLDLSKIIGKWIEVDSQDTSALGVNENVNAGQFDAYIRDFERFITIAGQKKAVVIKKQGSEVITGVKTNKYHATITPEKLAVSLEQLIKEKKKRGEDTANYDTFLKDFQDPENQQSITDFFKQMSLDVWIDAKTKLPRQMDLRIGTLPMETVQTSGLNMVTEYRFTVLTTNQPQAVDKPTSTMTINEAFVAPVLDTDEVTEIYSNTNSALPSTNVNAGEWNTNINTNTAIMLDADNDGLTDAQETGVYQTDPNKADSDGDGYNDKEEINNGYNPNGTGKATAAQLLLWESGTASSTTTNTNTSPADSFASAQARARDARRKSDINGLRSSLALYNDDHNSYPADLSKLVPTYVQTLPVDPTTGANYGYQTCPGNHYLLSTDLESTTDKYYIDDALLEEQSATAVTCGSISDNTNTAS